MTPIASYNHELLMQDAGANYGRPYQQCAISVMDTIADPNISFDENGICNYYYEYLEAERKYVAKGDEGLEKLKGSFDAIRQAGKNKAYDCILGLSGGVDSTYLCWLAKQYELRPLIVHFDNGWNSELAVHNIEQTVNACNFDLFTFVVDWNEFRDLQRSYLKASVVDIEVLTDHGFMAVLYEQARKWNIQYVLAGMNIVTEQVLPKNWIFNKLDAENIKAIQQTYGSISPGKLKSFPFINYTTLRYCRDILQLKVETPLNYIPYFYDEVKKTIKEELGWRDYGGKHFESVWTRFYQGFILPNKFFIDKRKAHYSNLIFSGQINKEQALEKLQHPIYSSELLLADFDFVLKKLGYSKEEFIQYIESPRVEHNAFAVQGSLYNKYPILKPFKGVLNYLWNRGK